VLPSHQLSQAAAINEQKEKAAPLPSPQAVQPLHSAVAAFAFSPGRDHLTKLSACTVPPLAPLLSAQRAQSIPQICGLLL
jgi:hypothetical protein